MLKPMTDADVQSCIEDATFAFTMGDTDEAVSNLAAATADRPDSFEAWRALSEVFFNLKRLAEAREAAEHAHKLRPDDIPMMMHLSRICLDAGDREAAEKHATAARLMGWNNHVHQPVA